MDVGSVLFGGVIGVGVGLALSYPVGYLRERGRARAVRRLRASEPARRQKERRRAKKRAAADQMARQKAHMKKVEAIAAERVGTRFLHRENKESPGHPVVVLELQKRDPMKRVVIQYDPPRDVGPYCQRVSVEWRALLRSEAEQRHLTARLEAKSHDDNEGWVEFERLD